MKVVTCVTLSSSALIPSPCVGIFKQMGVTAVSCAVDLLVLSKA